MPRFFTIDNNLYICSGNLNYKTKSSNFYDFLSIFKEFLIGYFINSSLNWTLLIQQWSMI